jgi:hypothetical protein
MKDGGTNGGTLEWVFHLIFNFRLDSDNKANDPSGFG